MATTTGTVEEAPPILPVPENWPSHIPYVTTPHYSRHLTSSHFAALRRRPPPPVSHQHCNSSGDDEQLVRIPRSLKPGPSSSVLITPITDPRHPACGQYGLFAARDLKPGELVLPYLGEVHVGTAVPGKGVDGGDTHGANRNAKEESISEDVDHQEQDEEDPNYDYTKSDYDLWLDRDGDVAVDAARVGNEARFVNDYRGVPPRLLLSHDEKGRTVKKNDKRAYNGNGNDKRKPNAEFKVVWDPRLADGRGEKCMAVFVLPAGKKATGRAREVGIAKGEEVLVSYGKGFWEGRRGEEGKE